MTTPMPARKIVKVTEAWSCASCKTVVLPYRGRRTITACPDCADSDWHPVTIYKMVEPKPGVCS